MIVASMVVAPRIPRIRGSTRRQSAAVSRSASCPPNFWDEGGRNGYSSHATVEGVDSMPTTISAGIRGYCSALLASAGAVETAVVGAGATGLFELSPQRLPRAMSPHLEVVGRDAETLGDLLG